MIEIRFEGIYQTRLDISKKNISEKKAKLTKKSDVSFADMLKIEKEKLEEKR